jgi:hypothetical protein
MNDGDMVQLIREPFEDVHAATALSAVIRQGRALRRRRRLARWGGAGALATVGALGVTMLSSGSLDTAKLAAWTVAVQPHSVVVRISELRDPAGLQRTLRADGVPATVRFNGQMPPSCLFYPGTPSQIFTLTRRIFYSAAPSGAAFTIDTSAIPAKVGLWLTVSPVRSAGQSGGMTAESFTGSEALVYASGKCPSVR